MIDNWHLYYPRFKHLRFRDPDPEYLGQTILNKEGQQHLARKFNSKSVLWSPTKNAFIYTNNVTVTFPLDRVPSSKPPSRAPSRAQSPEDSQDEEIVTSLLERAGQALTTLTEEHWQRTPEPSSVGAPPGTFPETPLQKQALTVLPTPSTEGPSTQVTAAAAPTLPTVVQYPSHQHQHLLKS